MVNVFQYLLNLVLFSRSYVIAFWYLLGDIFFFDLELIEE